MTFNAAAVTRHYWRSILVGNGTGGARLFASSTTPKMKHFNPTVDSIHSHHPPPKSRGLTGPEQGPVLGSTGRSGPGFTTLVHTTKQQLFHSLAVQISKKRRESILEVEDPNYIMVDSNKFLNKSFLRKELIFRTTTPPKLILPGLTFTLDPKKLSHRNQLVQKSEVGH